MKKKYLELYKRVIQLRKRTGWGRRKIARELGISENTVGNWLYPRSKGKEYHRDWERKHREHLRDYRREHRLMTSGYRVLVGRKHPHPEHQRCELCEKRRDRLEYHHYDDKDLSKGLWLCNECHHIFAEMVDDGLTIADITAKMGSASVNKNSWLKYRKLIAKYKKLKSSILNL